VSAVTGTPALDVAARILGGRAVRDEPLAPLTTYRVGGAAALFVPASTLADLLAVAAARRESGLPVLVDGAQSAGAIPVEIGELDFYTVSAQKWLCSPEPSGALYVRDPELVRIKTPTYFSQESYELTGAFVPKATSVRFDGGWIGAPALSGIVAALATHPEWRYERGAEMAARCAELIAPHAEVITPPGNSTLVSFRPSGDPEQLVASLQERGVVVREIPKRNLVRASCGWWTNEDDLQRLVAGLAG